MKIYSLLILKLAVIIDYTLLKNSEKQSESKLIDKNKDTDYLYGKAKVIANT